MSKKTKSKKKHHKKTRKKGYLLFLFLIIFLPIIAVIGFKLYEIGQDRAKRIAKEKAANDELISKMKKLLEDEKVFSDKIAAKSKIDEKKQTQYATEAEDYKKSLEKFKKKEDKKQKQKIEKKAEEKTAYLHKKRPPKPKLAIVIDDVAFERDVKRLKTLPFKVTPSFFPPSPIHPKTNLLAKEFDFYMVHLPLEAFNFIAPEPDTLTTKNSFIQMNQRIKNIRKWFPKASYINNHTGSKFTADFNAMKKLYKALENQGFIFLDSRTTPNTQAKRVAQIFHKNLLSRDVFLDNKADCSYIKRQLKKAVRLAKKNGYAIAIGHPRSFTFKTL